MSIGWGTMGRVQRWCLGLLAVAPLAVATTACTIEQPAPPARGAQGAEYLQPFGAPTRPFSPAVRVGELIFLSGQLGTDPSTGGTVVPGGIEAETRQALKNVRAVLDSVGSGMDKVVKCTVMMVEMREWDRMNDVYREFFPSGRLPARSTFGVTALARGARVEIECFATR